MLMFVMLRTWEDMIIDLYLLSFLHIEMAQVVQVIPHGRQASQFIVYIVNTKLMS